MEPTNINKIILNINKLKIFIIIIIIIIILLSSILLILAKNPIHSIFFLILSFIFTIFLFFIFKLEFLPIIILIIYVGAISILFLFIIMLLNIKLIEINETFFNYFPLNSLILTFFFFEFISLLNLNLIEINLSTYIYFYLDNINVLKKILYFTEEYYYNYMISFNGINFSLLDIQLIAEIIYEKNYYYFIIASFILLSAMVGSIVLTLNNNKFIKHQSISSQVYRTVTLDFLYK